MITLTTELIQIKGVNQRLVERLARLDIHTVRDLLWHFPYRYEDFSAVARITDLQPNQSVTIRGVVKRVTTRRTWRRHITIVEASIADESGAIKAVWFNQIFLTRILRPGLRANFAGKVAVSGDELYLSNPAYEFVGGGGEQSARGSHTARLVPIYPETRGLTSRGIRYLVTLLMRAVGPLPDCIPDDVRATHAIPDINTALHAVHFPERIEDAESAKKRFAFENLFLLHLRNLMMRKALASERGFAVRLPDAELASAIAALPFRLTASQEESVREIVGDLARGRPMNRLLQGDVGSGKTVVAALAAFAVARNGTQAVFMAPTEVLARQHYQTLSSIMSRIGGNAPPGVGLLLSGEARTSYGAGLEGKKPKRALLKSLAAGDLPIAVGTHALIQRGVAFKELAFVVIDEQHRFGVDQRAALAARAADSTPRLPHFLSMSATPIPRTLSLTLFGDLDLSTITELPTGRKAIITKVVDPANRTKAYAFLREQIKAGRQAFVICPRIEPSKEDAADGDGRPGPQGLFTKRELLMREAKTVKEEYEKLATQIFPDLRVGMLHGKMKSAEKEAVMRAFREGGIDVLVATSVIEVGVDVPNASVMMIEGAEHFGLAQLYQFRGRIGRGIHQSFCLLFTHGSSPLTHERLRALLTAKNGFELAEEDLKLRGPGQFLGERQTGLPDLAMRALTNIALIKATREAAESVLRRDPTFSRSPLLKERIAVFAQQIHLE